MFKRPAIQIDHFNSQWKHLILGAITTFLIIAMIFALAELLRAQTKTEIDVGKITVPVVSIEDPELIEFFMYEFFVAETLVTRLEIIDATSNGFGEDDLVKTYPSEAIYFPIPSDSAQAIMNSWKFKANFQIVTEDRAPDDFENLDSEKAENGIFASILRGVNRNYEDQDINIWFSRDPQGITFEMWGYNIDSLNYNAPPPAQPDSITTYDVVHVLTSDTLMTADTTLYDVIYVVKTVTDTVYVTY
jgi:hypothetical protein